MRVGRHNVVATFADLDQAREAVESLGRAGVDADRISMLGRQVEEASSNPDTRLRDMAATGEMAKNAGKGLAAGGLLGGLAGAAAFAIPGVGPVIGAGIWAAAAGGAIAGGSVGGVMGGIATFSLSDEWELTFQDAVRDGRVLVAVHGDDPAEIERAAEVLEKAGPEKLERVDGSGEPLEPAGDTAGTGPAAEAHGERPAPS